MKLVSRREFFKNFFISLSLPLAWIWYSTTRRSNEVSIHTKKTVIDNDFPNGITFHENFIVIKQNSSIKIFSSKCSHLGCRIKGTEQNDLVCPCHGSRYNFNGDVVKGPAQNSLKLLEFKRDGNKLIVYES